MVVAYAPLSIGATYDFSTIDYTIVTHVVEHAVCTNGNGTLDLTNLGGTFPVPNLVEDAHDGGAKAILGLCGDPGTTDEFAEMASTKTSRTAFITHVMGLVKEYDFDGVDIDWEYPSTHTDADKLDLLAGEMRAALGPGQTLSIVTPNATGLAQYFDLPSLVPLVDWFDVLTYDYSDPATSATSYPDAPLYPTGDKGSVTGTMQYYLSRGVPRAELLVGLPFEGKQYDGATMLNEHLSNHHGKSSLAYSAIVPLVGAGWTAYYDSTNVAAYLLTSDGAAGVIVYDDPLSIRTKCDYVACSRLGGAILWHLGEDVLSGSQPLLEAARGCR
jgi:chitinase